MWTSIKDERGKHAYSNLNTPTGRIIDSCGVADGIVFIPGENINDSGAVVPAPGFSTSEDMITIRRVADKWVAAGRCLLLTDTAGDTPMQALAAASLTLAWTNGNTCMDEDRTAMIADLIARAEKAEAIAEEVHKTAFEMEERAKKAEQREASACSNAYDSENHMRYYQSRAGLLREERDVALAKLKKVSEWVEADECHSGDMFVARLDVKKILRGES